ncbi:MAG: hypothetical protein AAF458_15960 [Pseudomonadota bacterium]
MDIPNTVTDVAWSQLFDGGDDHFDAIQPAYDEVQRGQQPTALIVELLCEQTAKLGVQLEQPAAEQVGGIGGNRFELSPRGLDDSDIPLVHAALRLRLWMRASLRQGCVGTFAQKA